MFNLDEGKIVSFLGALFLSPASYVLKKTIEYIGAWWLPVRKANLAFETGVKFFITIGEVPSANEINMLKSEISKRYNIPVCQIDDIYTTIVHIYTKSICSEQLSNQEKEEIRLHIFRQGTRYREQNIVYKTEGAEFIRDVLFTMMVVFLIGVINFLGLGKMIDSFDIIIWVVYSFFAALILLWSSVFVTRVSNKLMSNTSLRMAYDSRYKNAVVHGCIWYKQNAPLRDREIPHLDTHEDKFLRSSAY